MEKCEPRGNYDDAKDNWRVLYFSQWYIDIFFHVIKGGGIAFLFILTNDASTVHESSILASFVSICYCTQNAHLTVSIVAYSGCNHNRNK
jgi:hypothetical protein